MTRAAFDAAAKRLVERTTAEQHIPVTVANPAVLAKVAAAITRQRTGGDRHAQRATA